jgi:hypothetical protein
LARFSVKLEVTLRAARSIGVEIEVPEAVLSELCRHLTKRTKDQFETTKRSLRRFGFLTSNPQLESATPEWEAIIDGCERIA